MVSDTLDQIDDAPMPELRDKLIARLRRMWGKDGHRTSLIHIENVNTAFIHETVRTLDTPEVRKIWPYWTFDAVMDDRTSHHCEALDGVVRPQARHGGTTATSRRFTSAAAAASSLACRCRRRTARA